MRKADFLPVILALAALGCSQQPKAVFVDVDAILAAEQVPAPEKVKLPSPPATLGAETLVLQALPGRTLMDRSRGQVAEARRQLELDRQLAQKNLERRLRTIYLAEVDAQSQDELAAARTEEKALLDAAYARLYDLFEPFAVKRGALVNREEILTNPVRHRFEYHPPEPGSARAKAEAAELQSIRAQIKQLDLDYDTAARAVLDDAQRQIDSLLTRLNAALQERKTQAGERAKAEATRQVKESRAGLESQLEGATAVRVAPSPSHQVSVSGVSPAPPAPSADVRGLMESPAERRQLIEQQLAIWLKISGLTRAKDSKGAQDKTEEFKRWRAMYTVGS